MPPRAMACTNRSADEMLRTGLSERTAVGLANQVVAGTKTAHIPSAFTSPLQISKRAQLKTEATRLAQHTRRASRRTPRGQKATTLKLVPASRSFSVEECPLDTQTPTTSSRATAYALGPGISQLTFFCGYYFQISKFLYPGFSHIYRSTDLRIGTSV